MSQRMWVVGSLGFMYVLMHLGAGCQGPVTTRDETKLAVVEPVETEERADRPIELPLDSPTIEIEDVSVNPQTDGIGAFQVPGGKGRDWKIWSKTPDVSSDKAGPWYTEVPYVPQLGVGEIYDAVSRRLHLRLVSQPGTDKVSRTRAAQVIRQYYVDRGQAEATITVKPESVMSLTYSRYDLKLRFLDKNGMEQVRQVDSRILGAGTGASPTIEVGYPVQVTDGDLHQLLVDKRYGEITLVLTVHYPSKKLATNEVVVTLSRAGLSRARENVFGKGTQVFVDRTGKREYRDALIQQFEAYARGADQDSLRAMRDTATAYFDDNLRPMDMRDLRKIDSTVFIWDEATGRRELSPAEFQNILNEYEKREEYFNEWSRWFDDLYKQSLYEQDDRKFHSEAKKIFKGANAGGFNLNIVDILSLGANSSLHLETESENLTEQELKHVRNFREELRRQGSQKQTLMTKAYEEWRGAVGQTGTIPKELEIFRISDGDATEFFVNHVVYHHPRGKLDQPFPIEYQLGDFAKQQSFAYYDVGTVVAFAGPADHRPLGWLLCDGTEYNLRENPEYTDLFEIIGTTYGGSESENTFKVPDYRGLFLRGVDDPDGEGGKRPAGIDEVGAREDPVTGLKRPGVGSVQDDATALPTTHFYANLEHDHGHGRAVFVSTHGGGTQSGRNEDGGGTTSRSLSKTQDTSQGGGDEETRPKNVAVNWFIKY